MIAVNQTFQTAINLVQLFPEFLSLHLPSITDLRTISPSGLSGHANLQGLTVLFNPGREFGNLYLTVLLHKNMQSLTFYLFMRNLETNTYIICFRIISPFQKSCHGFSLGWTYWDHTN